jgi:hypothetical protein
MLDNTQLDFPIKNEEEHIETIFNECNVFSFYKNKLVIMSKDDFIKRCLTFDVKSYDHALQKLAFAIDSIGILTDTIPTSVLSKLNNLKERYSNVNHVEIIQALNDLNTRAFQNVSYEFPNGYLKCYKDKSMPLAQRKYCLNSLIDQYGRSSNFDKVLSLEQEFNKYFGNPDRQLDYLFISAIDSVKIYLSKIDSLNNLEISDDSLFYFKALALESICQTHWYCSQICDFSLITDKLKFLSSKFPESQLIDNAMLYVLNTSYGYDEGDPEFLISLNQEYEEFMKNYPDSDLNSDIAYDIFNNWVSIEPLNYKKIKATGQRFINEFPSDKRIVEIKRLLNKYKIK